MGKAVPKGIKSRAETLLNFFPENFCESFEKNKEFIESLEMSLSKQNRNWVAGFITRRMVQRAAKAS
ncbi:MAG: 30S ribosomal protein S17e [archaeon]